MGRFFEWWFDRVDLMWFVFCLNKKLFFTRSIELQMNRRIDEEIQDKLIVTNVFYYIRVIPLYKFWHLLVLLRTKTYYFFHKLSKKKKRGVYTKFWNFWSRFFAWICFVTMELVELRWNRELQKLKFFDPIFTFCIVFLSVLGPIVSTHFYSIGIER